MAINFQNIFGVHETALSLRAERAEVLANNLANADTPGFKARDIDFAQALSQAQSMQPSGLSKTHPLHFDSQRGNDQSGKDKPALLYRTPMQPDTGDGNSVDAQIEQAKFAENALQYETSLRFLDGKIKSLLLAIKGE